MDRRWLLWLMVGFLALSPAAVQARTGASPAAAPLLTGAAPSTIYNNLDTPILINGSGFEEGITAALGDVPLQAVTRLGETQLSAVVPWGLDPGWYALRVANPGGEEALLADALEVQAGLGTWVSGGPYGGQVHDLAVDPGDSSHAWASVWNSGLYETLDGGETWSRVWNDPGTRGAAYGSQALNGSYPLYAWGGGGVRRYPNDSDTYTLLYAGGAQYFAAAPDGLDLWAAGMDGGLFHSANGGTAWSADLRSGPLAGESVVIAAIAPDGIYAGTARGEVFFGEEIPPAWVKRTSGMGDVPADNFPVHVLSVHPADPERILVSHWQETGQAAHLSTDGGETWHGVHLEDGALNDLISDVNYSAATTSTLYAAVMAGSLWAVSEDGGETWSGRSPRSCDYTLSIGRAGDGDVFYLGGGASGVLRTEDGGAAFELKSRGITALPVVDVAASSAQPGTVFVAGEHAGSFRSLSAGSQWEMLDMPEFCASFSVGAAPQLAGKAYFGSQAVSNNLADDDAWTRVRVRTSPDDGWLLLHAVRPAPSDPQVIYAGGRDQHGGGVNQATGVLFRSTDGGSTWAALDLPVRTGDTAPAPLWDVAIHPQNPLEIYAALAWWRGGTPQAGFSVGLFHSVDGGDTWQETALSGRSVKSALFDPARPAILYAGVALDEGASYERGTVYRSADGGATWEDTHLGDLLPWGWADRLALDPQTPAALYAGTENGLFFSPDGGAHWSRAAGSLGGVGITGLAAVVQGERSVIYAGTTGGFPAAGGAALDGRAVSEFVDGGVYQLTAFRYKRYLPVMRRGQALTYGMMGTTAAAAHPR